MGGGRRCDPLAAHDGRPLQTKVLGQQGFNMETLLTLNAGSSSVRFALFPAIDPREPTLSGMADRLESTGFRLTVRGGGSGADSVHPMEGPVAESLLDWLETRDEFRGVQAVGHRIVHGMQHSGPAWVTEELLAELNGIRAYAPEHLPCEIGLVEAVRRRRPELRQLACFDTAFHRTLPRVATLIPLPRRYETEGIQRYGFHGLSYAYLIRELITHGDEAATRGRVVLAHLGNGASLAAVRDGRCVDTSMGFTPASGIPMGTRSGDLDPGVFGRLAVHGGMTAAQIDWMLNHESGLLGLSGISSDMRDLLALEHSDARAADAVELFCYQTRKWIGAFAAVLGGVDTVVFVGGIGENCPSVRWRICAELGFLGVELDPVRNAQAPGVISSEKSRVSVRVMCTDEELAIARLMDERLQQFPASGPSRLSAPSAL